MFARIAIAISMLFLISACSTTSDKGAGADARHSSQVTDRYGIESESLEPFTVISNQDGNVVRASDRVFFDYDSSALSVAAQRTLDRQVKWLKENKRVNVTVEGHCDERGTREYNLALGERRANAVKNYLVSSGVSAGRVATISYGKERPAVLGHSLDSYAENRRGVTVPDNM